ncbi:MAG: ribosomal protein S18-alanine N-acetyltransferase [Burkholderiales bacterium]
MQIRRAKLTDLDNLAQLDYQANLTYWQRDSYASCLNNKSNLLYVLEVAARQIAGAIAVSVVADEAEILQLWISQQFQGQGYGKWLLKDMLQKLKLNHGVSRVFLEVREGNLPAIKLYEAVGFVMAGRRKNYYTVDRWQFDALVMLLS